MSVAPKFAVFARSVASKPAVYGSIQLPSIRIGQPDALNESGRGIGDGATPKKVFGTGTEVATRLKVAPVAPTQRKQANPRERRRRERVGADTLRIRSGIAGRSHATQSQTAGVAPQSESDPVWLIGLIQWQRRSSIVTFLLAIATLAVYGGTVYTQQLWNREYRQLETLQVQKRQLTAASEVLKKQIADQAERQDTGLVPAKPSDNLFLEAGGNQPKNSPNSTPAPNSATSPQLTPTPLGY